MTVADPTGKAQSPTNRGGKTLYNASRRELLEVKL